ncbi:hypothetical protein V6957_003714 [Vibrio parahaemolyticus]|jgi:hypothetical protein|uniref:Lipoprotein n=9 Tax=Vibrionaceae TaxID=641 RepID=A0A0C3I9K2_9VIBR|nr:MULTISPECIES: hypothetical protein [Vibrionaceae]EKO3796599.1 hypothetical protein [Vibrio metschnikovii]MBY8081926.1 hypothetical protein [Vibrio fluvialis]MDW1968596.1 hypothetical protein [Vibrio sp. 945]QLK49915.1 hypothetical protein DR996_33590 [Vibrio owensii]HCJ6891814.1 hypothetical protein [Vibrio cholerae]
MKKTALTIIAAFMLAGPAVAKTDKPYTEEVETFFETFELMCESCAEVSEFMVQTLEEKCDQPITIENIQNVTKTHPLYAFLLAMGNMNPDGKPLSFQSAADNVDCNDGMKWVEKTQSAMKAAYQEQKKQAQNG